MGDVLSASERLRVEAEEYLELDEDRVFVPTRISGRGKSSGVELGQIRSGATVFHIRDGKASRLVVYFSRDHVLADLTLAPDTGTPGS